MTHRQRTLDAWLRIVFSLYTRTPRDPNVSRRTISNSEVLQWFTRPGGEAHIFNMLGELARAVPDACYGRRRRSDDAPQVSGRLAAALTAHVVRFERFAGCGHAVVPEAPEAALAM